MSTVATRLVVVSNRLPIALKRKGGEVSVQPGKGGLVTALGPVLQHRGGDWIGWPGTAGGEDVQPYLDAYSGQAGYNLHAVPLTEEEVDGFYKGFSNAVIWPLFHDFSSLCDFDPRYFESYLGVNRKYAAIVAEKSGESDYIWVHDYHLMHVAWSLKRLRIKRRCGFFLHIPFPPPDIFLKLPWRREIIEALLEYDLVGFQTFRDRRNFTQCVHTLASDVKISGRGPVVSATVDNRTVNVGYFPIGIDFKSFNDAARTKQAAEKAGQLQAALRHRAIVLGADRLDYSKGIPERVEAMRSLFRNHPEMREKVSLIQVVVPSRESVRGYGSKKLRIESLVAEVNGEFTTPGWVPIHYLYRNLGREELVAYYRAAVVGLVTPLRDGMNLVAKEYCACNVTGAGVLVLSEFAGAAAQLQSGALLVNPYDVDSVAEAVHAACTMPQEDRGQRMHKLRTRIRKYDIFWWVDAFLEAGLGKTLSDFQHIKGVDYHSAD